LLSPQSPERVEAGKDRALVDSHDPAKERRRWREDLKTESLRALVKDGGGCEGLDRSVARVAFSEAGQSFQGALEGAEHEDPGAGRVSRPVMDGRDPLVIEVNGPHQVTGQNNGPVA
jgi:hypothetical protein